MCAGEGSDCLLEGWGSLLDILHEGDIVLRLFQLEQVALAALLEFQHGCAAALEAVFAVVDGGGIGDDGCVEEEELQDLDRPFLVIRIKAVAYMVKEELQKVLKVNQIFLRQNPPDSKVINRRLNILQKTRMRTNRHFSHLRYITLLRHQTPLSLNKKLPKNLGQHLLHRLLQLLIRIRHHPQNTVKSFKTLPLHAQNNHFLH